MNVEWCITELGTECLHITSNGGPLSRLTLALVTANMKSRIRKVGLSAREVWTQRYQITGVQLPVEDRGLITQQHREHLANHPISAKFKSGGKPPLETPQISIGDLACLTCDSDKTETRNKYTVTKLGGKHCLLSWWSSWTQCTSLYTPCTLRLRMSSEQQ